MHYTYLLLSHHDKRFYTDCSSSYEACLSRDDALRREHFLKTGKGKRYLRNRLAGFLSSLREDKLERH